MANEPVEINPIASFLTKFVSMAITQAGAPALEAFAETELPFLAAPVVKQIFEYAINQFAQKLSVSTQNGIITLVVDVQTDSELHGILTAALALNAANASGDTNAISKATQDAISAWGDVIHWDGITHAG